MSRVEETVKWHPMPRQGCLSGRVLLVTLNLSSERTSTSGGMNVLDQGNEEAAISDCLRQQPACSKLSVYGLHCNLAAVNGRFRNSSAQRLLAFKPCPQVGKC